MSPIIGKSMMKTLNATGNNTDSVLVNKVAIPNYGDIIVTKLYGKDTSYGNNHPRFIAKDENGNFEYIIKRLLAKGGDQLRVNEYDGDYYIELKKKGETDFTEIDEENYLNTEVGHHSSENFETLYNNLNKLSGANYDDWKATSPDSVIFGDVLTIPEGYWFYMGDNRGGNSSVHGRSWDCSSLGPQKAEYCLGVATDILANNESVPAFLWRKFCYYVLFGWVGDL
jgi:signal peptidase I